MIFNVLPRRNRSDLWRGVFFAACVFSLAALANTVRAAESSDPAVDIELDAELEKRLATPFFDDLDGILQRNVLRVAVTYNQTSYFIDKGQQKGLAYESMKAFGEALQKKYGKKKKQGPPLAVVFIPVARDQLLTRLQQGTADIAAANLTITAKRLEQIDFSVPLATGVKELVVSSEAAEVPASIDGLSGKTVAVRKSSSYYEHLSALNQRLLAADQPPVDIHLVDEHLETEDLLDMVNAGLIDYTIADSHLAKLWQEVFPNIRVHEQLALATEGNIGWALRKNTPQLMDELNAFARTHRLGTTFGNVLRKRYIDSPYWVRRATAVDAREKFQQTVSLFKQYASRYDFDYLMLMAQAFQESGLDHERRSPVGAIGIMQVMPETGESLGVGDVSQLEPNVHAGAKYLRQMMETYFNDPAIDNLNRMLFAFAGYNAGPNRIQKLRERTAKNGLNPNLWYGNVEQTVARHVGQETVRYVTNIAKYYVAYSLIAKQQDNRRQAEQVIKKESPAQQ